MTDIPGDFEILKPWLPLVRDARRAGHTNGLAIITLRVLVDEHGNPIQYSEATCVKLMPLSKREALEAILSDLCRG